MACMGVVLLRCYANRQETCICSMCGVAVLLVRVQFVAWCGCGVVVGCVVQLIVCLNVDVSLQLQGELLQSIQACCCQAVGAAATCVGV